MSFARNIGKNICKNISKNLSGKYSQKCLIMLNNLQKMHLKNKTTNRKVSRISKQNNPEAITNEHDKEMSEERYISPEERKKIIDDLRLI